MTDRDRIEVEDGRECVVVKFVDRKILNDPTMEVLAEKLFGLVLNLGRRQLILDFCNVQYLQSSALGVLVTVHRKVIAGGGQLIFRNIDPEVRRVLSMTRLDQLFTVEGADSAGKTDQSS